MEVGCEVHAPVASPPEKQPLVIMEKDDRWALNVA